MLPAAAALTPRAGRDRVAGDDSHDERTDGDRDQTRCRRAGDSSRTRSMLPSAEVDMLPGNASDTLLRRGDVAEWLRSGLQSRVRRFDSGRRLSLGAGIPGRFTAPSYHA